MRHQFVFLIQLQDYVWDFNFFDFCNFMEPLCGLPNISSIFQKSKIVDVLDGLFSCLVSVVYISRVEGKSDVTIYELRRQLGQFTV